MPGALIQVGAQLLCPHGGTITIVPPGARVTSDGAPVASIAATGIVAGCTNTGGPRKPCSTVTWILGAARVTIGGVPALVETSLAAFDSVPPVVGVPATALSTQEHATGT
jgi:hypothetical protein